MQIWFSWYLDLYMKITKIKEDITPEIANSLKNSIAIDTEATGLQIPERDKLSLINL